MPSRSVSITSGGVTTTKIIPDRDAQAGVRTLDVDGQTVTVNRTASVNKSDRAGESRPLLSKVVGGAAAAYSLRDLNDKAGNNKVVNVRRDGDQAERAFLAKEVNKIADWVNGKQETTLPADIPANPQNITSFDATFGGIGWDGTFLFQSANNRWFKGLGSDVSIKKSTTGPNIGKWRVFSDYDYDEEPTSLTSDQITDYPWEVTSWTVAAGDEGTPNGNVSFSNFVGGSIDNTPAAAYSLRKVRSAYSGNAVQIRRASDNVEVNVAFDSNGEVSASSAITNVTESPDQGDTTATTLGEFIVGNENNIVDFSSGSNDLFSHGDGTSIKFLAYGNSLSRTAYNHLTDSESIGASPSVTSDYSFRLDTRATGGYNPTHGITFRPLVKKYAYSVTFKYYIPEGQPNLQIIYGTKSANLDVQGAWTEVTVSSSASQGHRDVLLRNIAHSTTGGLWYIADLRMNLSAFDTYVVTWYDQSGNSNDATQPTTASQPKIAEGGSLLEALEFDSTDDFLSLTNTVSFENLPLSMFSVQDAQPTHNHHTMGCANSRGVGVSGNTVQYFFTSSTATLTFDSTISGLNLYSAIHDGTTDADNITAHRNGVANSSSSGTGMGQLNSSTVWTNIGVRANTNDFFHGTIKELIVFNSDQSANRFKIESNINNHYGLYNTAYDGFVETWYDQSGNGNDAVQSNINYQPKIVSAGTYLGEIDFDGVDDFFDASDPLDGATAHTSIVVANPSTAGRILSLKEDGRSDENWRMLINISNEASYGLDDGTAYSANSAITLGNSTLLFGSYDSSELKISVNGGAPVPQSVSGFTLNTTGSLQIGKNANSGGNRYTGKIKEIILYPSDQSANRSDIEANINGRYSIY